MFHYSKDSTRWYALAGHFAAPNGSDKKQEGTIINGAFVACHSKLSTHVSYANERRRDNPRQQHDLLAPPPLSHVA